MTRKLDDYVTDEHIARYASEGCVRVERVFDSKTCANLAAVLNDALRAFDAGTLQRAADASAHQNPPSVHRGDGQVQLRNFAQHLPELRDWLWNSVAAEVVARLMGARHVRYWMDASFIKEGSSADSATPWHNDECTFPFRGEMMPSFWVALTDVPMDNAPMVTLTGSNRDPWRYHSPMSDPTAFELEHIPWSHLERRVADSQTPRQIWPCAAGDILLIHPKTIHASLPRTAQYAGQRIALTTRWLGDDVVWQPNKLTIRIPSIESTGLMKPGASPPDELFPKVWPRE
ncbi:MAG: phytanoyl-CoA dioxygenase family protein [Sinobacteraceae bacterium]|nr:phytanoyl-CoA dioxygenase family protein [Nevskiaceae bacterium]